MKHIEKATFGTTTRVEERHQPNLATELIDAIKSNNLRATKAALAIGLNVDNIQIGSKPALRFCGEKGNRDLCELLVAYGANVNMKSGKREYSFLHNAAASGNFGFASILLSLGASPSPRSSNNSTPLHFASRLGHSYLAAKLLEHGAEIDAQDNHGQSPLMLAFKNSSLCVAKMLVKNRPNLDLADQKGLTPRKVAETHGPPWTELSYD